MLTATARTVTFLFRKHDKKGRGLLYDHRERVARLLRSDHDHGFGRAEWWEGTPLEDKNWYPKIDNM
jgi:hypothetical protein